MAVQKLRFSDIIANVVMETAGFDVRDYVEDKGDSAIRYHAENHGLRIVSGVKVLIRPVVMDFLRGLRDVKEGEKPDSWVFDFTAEAVPA